MTIEDMFETEHIEMNTVGIDIGSSTSHLHFSRIFLVRLGAALSSRYVVVDKKVLYESDILLTPYIAGTTIDTESLGTFINEAYQKAGMKRDDVDTGALILTGEAVKKENARAIGDLFAAEAGRFVAVSAGDNLESVMSAYGSGAVEFSQRNHNTVMAVDVPELVVGDAVDTVESAEAPKDREMADDCVSPSCITALSSDGAALRMRTTPPSAATSDKVNASPLLGG